MNTLFDAFAQNFTAKNGPLAVRMRPDSFAGFVGQEDACGPESWLRHSIEQDTLASVLLFGPPGTGKTTLAHIIAHSTKGEYVEVSAVGGSVADLRREINLARDRLLGSGKRTVLFVDEIHRFNRGQQDALLHAVEDRTVILVGATTENPYFEVNSALISRMRVVELHALKDADILTLLDRALHAPQGLANAFVLDTDAAELLAAASGGDARAALSSLELAADLAGGAAAAADAGSATTAATATATEKPHITVAHVREILGARRLPYDKSGDMHYDVISAFIKSMRGSDPDAALYWLARMIDGGEDPVFIARRILICASEDIGNADPFALVVAQAAFYATTVIGLPECRINLAQAAVYLACAPKSNAVIRGIDAALDEVRHGPARPVPAHLRDRHRPGSENYGAYLYPHDYPGGYVPQQYLPDGLAPGCFWRPEDRRQE